MRSFIQAIVEQFECFEGRLQLALGDSREERIDKYSVLLPHLAKAHLAGCGQADQVGSFVPWIGFFCHQPLVQERVDGHLDVLSRDVVAFRDLRHRQGFILEEELEHRTIRCRDAESVEVFSRDPRHLAENSAYQPGNFVIAFTGHGLSDLTSKLSICVLTIHLSIGFVVCCDIVPRMAATLAFDVYGTLIDPLWIARDVEQVIGPGAGRFAASWREKQIEYLFRRALARDYRPFSICTRDALNFTCELLGEDICESDRRKLMERYRGLPAYPGTLEALRSLAASDCRSFAFSNGEPGELGILLKGAGLTDFLDGIVSVDAVQSFKPDPSVYSHFLDAAGSEAGNTWLVSGNPFDVIGALTAGWNAAWLRRDEKAVFDPWGIEPTVVIGSLTELAAFIAR